MIAGGFGAFQCLLDSKNQYRTEVIAQFYDQHQSDVQVMDKWFSAQCIASVTSVKDIRDLMKHELFSMTNPNRIRSLIGSFSQNSIQFHCQEGYQLLTEVIIVLDQLNPQIAARFAGIYNHWRRYTAQYSKLQESQLPFDVVRARHVYDRQDIHEFAELLRDLIHG